MMGENYHNASRMMKKLLLATMVLMGMSANAQVVTYYGAGFHGKKTASGERFNQNALTCASNSHKFGTRLKVTNVKNGKSVICRVNDRGGFSKYGISLDLSKAAFAKIAPLSQGRARVTITPVRDVPAVAPVVEQADVMASNQANSEQVEQALPVIEPLSISQTVTITLSNNTSEQ